MYYFAYATNMPENAMSERTGSTKKGVKGILSGYKLIFTKKDTDVQTHANIISQEGSHIEGAIYDLSASELEKASVFEEEVSYYKKNTLKVESATGDVLDCIVYIADDFNIVKEQKPTEEYLERLLSNTKFLSQEYITEVRESIR